MNVLDLAFPITPTGPGWDNDLHTTSDAVDDVAAIIAHYGRGTLVGVGTNLDSEFRLQLEKDFLDGQPRLQPNGGHAQQTDVRFRARRRLPIGSGKSVRIAISLRFGPCLRDWPISPETSSRNSASARPACSNGRTAVRSPC